MIGVIPIFIKDKDRLNLITTRLNGKSIVAYCIGSALASKKLEKVFGFTNNDTVSEIFEKYSISYCRTAPDETTENSAILPYGSISACLSLNKDVNKGYSDLAIIGHSSPFLNADVIDSAISRFQSSGSDVLLSVKRVETHPALLSSMQDTFVKSSMINLIKRRSDIEMNRDRMSVVYPEDTPLLNYGRTYYCACQAFFSSGSFISSGWIKFTMPCGMDDNLNPYNIEERVGLKVINEGGDIPLTITFSKERLMHPTFSWKPVPNAVDYKLLISDPSMGSNGNMTAKKRIDNAIDADVVSSAYPEEAPPLRYGETYRCMVQAHVPSMSTITSGYVEFTTPDSSDDDLESYNIRGHTGIGREGELSISVTFLKESPLQPIFSWNTLPNAVFYGLVISVPSPGLRGDIMMAYYTAKCDWRYDFSIGRRINALTGEVVTGRQQLPHLFEPDNAIFILKGGCLQNFDEVVSRGNAASFIMDMPEGLEIKGEIDLLKAKVLEKIRPNCINHTDQNER